jgi:hypothetical protein
MDWIDYGFATMIPEIPEIYSRFRFTSRRQLASLAFRSGTTLGTHPQFGARRLSKLLTIRKRV